MRILPEIVVLMALILLFRSIQGKNAPFLLYNTENSEATEAFDCLYYTQDEKTLPFCRRLGIPDLLDYHPSKCFNDGEKYLYVDLLAKEISPWTVLFWSSSVENADNYANVFYNRSAKIDEDKFLCNCTQPGTFGKYCEYQMPFDKFSFSDALQLPLSPGEYMEGYQEWGTILCYTTLSCSYGMLCLDWRDICDHHQNCMDGLDEENCDKLEFNECEDNEYRCMNGMCIPEEYWLDGVNDCMNWSDELEKSGTYACELTRVSIECMERLCFMGFYSCGNGECIGSFARYVFQTFRVATQHCLNLRELSYMCETNALIRLWTKPNGLCSLNFGYDDPTLDMKRQDLSDPYRCTYLIRCALSMGFEADCPCDTKCSILMVGICENETLYLYPGKGLIRPWLLHIYTWKRTWTEPKPSGLLLRGSIMCHGFHIKTSGTPLAIVPFRVEHLNSAFPDSEFCMYPRNGVHREAKSLYHYPINCWTDSFTFNSRRYAVSNSCVFSHTCISQYRVGDGLASCTGIDVSDELTSAIKSNNYCASIQKHRFQCSAELMTCMPVATLTGNRVCLDDYNYFLNVYKHPSCNRRSDEGCSILKYYIGNSSIPNSTFMEEMNKNIVAHHGSTPYRFYCDSFWDSVSNHIDESSFCLAWICPPEEYQCRTGQCIPLNWVCDGEWDCSDASDEEAIILNQPWSDHNQKLHNLNDRKQQCKKQYSIQPFWNICNLSYELPCFRAHVSNPLNIEVNRPCVNLTQIGDYFSDCFGGLDEKNTFKDCQGRMQGYTYRHNKTSLCRDISFGCIYADEQLSIFCWYKSKNSTCADDRDVRCLDGTCAKNARCDKKTSMLTWRR